MTVCPVNQGEQIVRKSADPVQVRHREKLLFPGTHPRRLIGTLANGAVTVATTVVANRFVTARKTLRRMDTRIGRATSDGGSTPAYQADGPPQDGR